LEKPPHDIFSWQNEKKKEDYFTQKWLVTGWKSYLKCLLAEIYNGIKISFPAKPTLAQGLA
jgi:hypothetical protein